MRIVHQQWQLVGSVLIVDDDGNAVVLGKDAQGNDARTGTIAIGIDRFRGNEVEAAYQKARAACEELLQKYQAMPAFDTEIKTPAPLVAVASIE